MHIKPQVVFLLLFLVTLCPAQVNMNDTSLLLVHGGFEWRASDVVTPNTVIDYIEIQNVLLSNDSRFGLHLEFKLRPSPSYVMILSRDAGAKLKQGLVQAGY